MGLKTIIVLEKEIREILASRPEELALAMAHVKMIENELYSNVLTFLEDFLNVIEGSTNDQLYDVNIYPCGFK